MKSKGGHDSRTGSSVFWQISATISPEINNAFAIANTNAGLVQDFTLMAGKGVPIDP